MKHSDNLTDLMEQLSKKSEAPAKENHVNSKWEVKNDDGEIVKLNDHLTRNRTGKF